MHICVQEVPTAALLDITNERTEFWFKDKLRNLTGSLNKETSSINTLLNRWRRMNSSYSSNRPDAIHPILQIVLMQFILFFKSSWCNSSYSSNRPVAKRLVRQGIETNHYPLKQLRRPLNSLLYLSFFSMLPTKNSLSKCTFTYYSRKSFLAERSNAHLWGTALSME